MEVALAEAFKRENTMEEGFSEETFEEANVTKDGFNLLLTDIENGHTNVQLEVDNYSNKLIVHAISYDKETKKDKRNVFKKEVGRKMSKVELQKVHDALFKMNKVGDIRNYIKNTLKVSKESKEEPGVPKKDGTGPNPDCSIKKEEDEEDKKEELFFSQLNNIKEKFNNEVINMEAKEFVEKYEKDLDDNKESFEKVTSILEGYDKRLTDLEAVEEEWIRE